MSAVSLKEFFFGDKTDKVKELMNWNQFKGVAQLNELASLSLNKEIVIFKHSPRCGISNTVLRRFEAKLIASHRDARFYLVNVISEREVSNAIAQRFQIIHQSPQVLIIKNEKVLAYASHYDILELDL